MKTERVFQPPIFIATVSGTPALTKLRHQNDQVSNMPGHWHAKGDSFFPFAHLPFPFEPSVVGVEWSGLQGFGGCTVSSASEAFPKLNVKGGVPSGWRLFHFQYSRSPLRCQGMTVSGLTMD